LPSAEVCITCVNARQSYQGLLFSHWSRKIVYPQCYSRWYGIIPSAAQFMLKHLSQITSYLLAACEVSPPNNMIKTSRSSSRNHKLALLWSPKSLIMRRKPSMRTFLSFPKVNGNKSWKSSSTTSWMKMVTSKEAPI
jgi:hypothetical protein